MTTKLNDLQRVLLSAAAARPDGNLLPLPDSIADHLGRVRKTLPTLLKRLLVEEVAVADPARAWRTEDEQRLGVILTRAGREAIGVAEPADAPVAVEPVPPAHPTKAAQVISMLRREQGATLADLVEATGWLPHTTRAALTGLRKKGHVLDKSKRDEVTCYRIAAVA